MIHTDSNETFLSYAELFSRSSQRCLEAERSLRGHLKEADAPYGEAMALVADAEHNLAMDLASYAEKGPENIVCTRVQYTPVLEETPDPNTLGDALKNVTQVNLELASLLQDLAHKATPQRLRDTIETLRKDVDAVNKQISMIRLTVQDI